MANSLNRYDVGLLDAQHKNIFKISICKSIVILIILLVLLFLSLFSYQIMVGYLIGALTSNVLFYNTIKMVKETNVNMYGKMVKRLNIVHTGVYLLVLLGVGLIFQSPYPVIACFVGLLSIKASIILDSIFFKEKK